MKYPKEYLDEIKTRLKVSTVVSKSVVLKKRGKEFVGLSPFKNEKTPSFTVNDEKEFYHCFSSAEHGDIFSFLMKHKNMSYPESIEYLAASPDGITPDGVMLEIKCPLSREIKGIPPIYYWQQMQQQLDWTVSQIKESRNELQTLNITFTSKIDSVGKMFQNKSRSTHLVVHQAAVEVRALTINLLVNRKPFRV